MILENVNDVHDDGLQLWQKIIDKLAQMSGSTAFLVINVLVFFFWTATGGLNQDHFPFQFLTMVVSLEAIILAILILISQNRQSTKDRIAAEVDYKTNVQAKLEIETILLRMEVQDAELLKQTILIEKLLKSPKSKNPPQEK